jgi:uncharacterized protein
LGCGEGGANARKHGVRFPDAVAVFADDAALTLYDPDAGEERYVTVGMDGTARLLVVVYTWRGREADQYARGET